VTSIAYTSILNSDYTKDPGCEEPRTPSQCGALFITPTIIW